MTISFVVLAECFAKGAGLALATYLLWKEKR